MANFLWVTGLANHRSGRLYISDAILLSHLQIGSYADICIATTAHFQSPSGFDLQQSQCIISGHHWRYPSNLKADWMIGRSIEEPLTDRFPSGSGLTNHRSEYADIAPILPVNRLRFKNKCCNDRKIPISFGFSPGPITLC